MTALMTGLCGRGKQYKVALSLARYNQYEDKYIQHYFVCDELT
jgi:hypothetical protein